MRKRLSNHIAVVITIVLLLICPINVLAADCSYNSSPLVSSANRTIYYVVIWSGFTLSEAQQYNYGCPDGFECHIYKTWSKGRTVYRVCYSCHSTRAKAQNKIREMQCSSLLAPWFQNAWIWASPGLGKCVFCPENQETGRLIPPLRPK